jgi:hypothetical protein
MGTFEDAMSAAERMGRDDGTAAGSWVFDGNTPEDAMRAFLAGVEDGDPAVLDTLPASPLSGEWAGAPLPGDILAAVGDESGYLIGDDDRDDILTAYEDAYAEAAQDEAVRYATAIVGE